MNIFKLLKLINLYRELKKDGEITKEDALKLIEALFS